MTVLTTLRLTLRPNRLTDAAAIATGLNNFAVAGNLSTVPFPYGEADALAWLKSLPVRPTPLNACFAIERNGEVIGNLGFHGRGDHAEVGYWLAEPHWGQGYMSEAARAAVDWYFETSNAELLTSGVFYFNPASLAVQTRLGFVQVTVGTRLCLARAIELRHIETELPRARWAALAKERAQ
jgi:RimJ/RimL family protein N-acetyltransferase